MAGEPLDVGPVVGVVDVPRPSTEAGFVVVGVGLLDVGLGRHDERPVLHDGFTDRASLQDQHLGGVAVVGVAAAGGVVGDADGHVASDDRTLPTLHLGVTDPHGAVTEHVDDAHGVGVAGNGHGPRRPLRHAEVPDVDVAVGTGGVGVRGRGGCPVSLHDLAGDDGDVHRAAGLVEQGVLGDLVVPQHREVGLDHLVAGGEVDPDLEQLGLVVLVVAQQREHLGVDDAGTGGHPLDVTTTEAGGRPQGVAVVHVAAAHEADRLEPAVGMLWEPRNE